MRKSLKDIVFFTIAVGLMSSCYGKKDDNFVRVIDLLHNEKLTPKKYQSSLEEWYQGNGTKIFNLGEKEAEQILENLKGYISKLPDSVKIEHEYDPRKGTITIFPSEGNYVDFFDLIKNMDLDIAFTFDNPRNHSYSLLRHKASK